MALSGGWSLPAEARARGGGAGGDIAIDIAAHTLADAIAELARERHVSIGTDGALPHVPTERVRATTVGDALARLLRGTGLVARQVGPSAWRIERLAPAPAAAQAAGPPQHRDVPEAEAGPPIVVTATKRPVPLANAPFDVSVVRMADAHPSMIGDSTAWIAANSDGVTSAGIGSGRNRLFLNGVADSPFNGDSQSTVAVLLDDARLTFSAPDPDIRLIDMARVEVLKGPQGTLYGTGALGGIYRLVTQRPDTTQYQASLTSGIQAIQHGGLGQSGSAMANIPLAPGHLALRLVAYGSRDAGWIDSGPRQDSNSETALGLRAGLGLDAGDWRIDATGFAQWLNSADTAYVPAPESFARPPQQREPHDNDLRHLAVRAERTGSVSAVLSAGVTWHEVIEDYDAAQGAGGLGMADPRLLERRHAYRTIDSEMRLSGRVGTVEWLGGVSHLEARQAGRRSLFDAAGTELPLDADDRTAVESALFGEATVPLFAAVTMQAGARLFRSHFEDAATLPGRATVARTRYGVTPGLSLAWSPRSGRSVYLRYGSAIRQGGATSGAGGQLVSLASDELATAELGWRERAMGGLLTVAAFHSWWENVQSDVLLPAGRIGTINAGNARITGVEIGWSGRLAARTGLTLAGTVLSAMLVRNASGIDLHDYHLPLVPRRTVRVTLDHDWDWGPWQARAALGLRYANGARLSFDPQLDFPIDGHVEGRIDLGLHRGRTDIGLSLTNVFASRSDVMPVGNPLRVGGGRQFTPARPRALALQLSRNF